MQKDNESDKAMNRNASLGAKSIIFFALSISLVVYRYTYDIESMIVSSSYHID